MTLDPNLLLALTVVIGQIITAVIAWQTRAIAQKTEINTNSMKDALVKSTMDSAHAQGKEEGRVEGEQKAATLAKGRLLGMTEKTPVSVEVVNVDKPVPVIVKEKSK